MLGVYFKFLDDVLLPSILTLMCGKLGRVCDNLGVFLYNRLGRHFEVSANMNQHVYFNFLDNEMLPFSQHIHGRQLFFKQQMRSAQRILVQSITPRLAFTITKICGTF